jgi:hypothetical protein
VGSRLYKPRNGVIKPTYRESKFRTLPLTKYNEHGFVRSNGRVNTDIFKILPIVPRIRNGIGI